LSDTNNGYVDLYHNLGAAELGAGRYAEAAKSFETAVQMNPRAPSLVGLAKALQALNRLDDALRAAELAIRTQSYPPAYAVAANILTQLGRHEEANRYLQHA
jgi:tetratricopeptide (TPR) repeat protein